MTDEEKKKADEERVKKWRRVVVAIGVLLALVCKSLPADYQAPCSVIAQLCSGGLLP